MPKKSLGQHFLSDPRILARIAGALPAGAGAAVLEIGPGRGALSRALVSRGVRLTMIERDRDLVAGLAREFPESTVIEADALDVNWLTALGVPPGALVCYWEHSLQHHEPPDREGARSGLASGCHRLSGSKRGGGPTRRRAGNL